MLSENIRAARESRGLSQRELAGRLCVVRQTVSKWERNLSVPDADLLISLAHELDVSVSALLGDSEASAEACAGEPAEGPGEPDVRALAQKLEALTFELARGKAARRRVAFGAVAVLVVLVVLGVVALTVLGSPYLAWDYTDPEVAVAGVLFHAFEWVFIRLAPIVFVAAGIGLALLWRKRAV